MKKGYLDELNDQQRLAVEHTEGPSLIIAGAGSGKTRVLTTRIAHLIKLGIDAFHILALTFTNKAAREMRNRIEHMAGTDAKNIWMGTFHSVFSRLLRSEAAKIGYPTNFTIYDTDDSKSLIRRILKEEQLDSKLYNPSFVYNRISALKNNLITPKMYLLNEEFISEDLSNGRPKFGEIYSKYYSRCFKAGAMDFDDLLLQTYFLLEKFPEVLNKYQQLFKYVLIDEFQDTNRVQYQIVKKLAASTRNLSVVGDDSQSIYSFRGASIKNILNFEKDYPELKIFKLEQNYRSTKTIVDASDNIIEKNKYRLPKKLWTSNQEGSKIQLIKASSESEEGNLVVQVILKEQKEFNRKLNDFVVLYRTNAQSRAFEESLRRFNLDYRLIGSLSFYKRKEIKDILAYCRFVLNHNDEESLQRIINYPARGIGNTTFARLIVLADDNQCSLWDIITNIRSFSLGERFLNAIDDFATLLKSFSIKIKELDAFEAVSYIAKESGIRKLLFEDKSIEGIARYENIQNLLSGIKEFTEREDIEQKDLGSFLQEVSLLTDADTKNEEGDKVTLMTAHSAKGLEFPVVFIVGLEENLFPSQLSMNSREEIEEERRLFYVAVTRAEHRLYMSYAASRFRWGNITFCESSRFLDEIDAQHIHYEFIQASAYPDFKPRTSDASKSRIRINKPKLKPQPRHIPPPDFIPDDTSSLRAGMEVEHSRFGQGKVIRIDGLAGNKKATINFNNFGEKQILLKFAKMKVIH
ncbi:MAG: UvrD-helicase domain-containing protein [Bacteroidetes bacterium]|nr:UvrD-helicase domain-containing protein [Bacteroidota bacterium]